MTQAPEPGTIDALSTAARAAGSDVDAQTLLWQAMFELERWYFVARGTTPDVAPLVGVVDGVAVVRRQSRDSRVRRVVAMAATLSREAVGQARRRTASATVANRAASRVAPSRRMRRVLTRMIRSTLTSLGRR